MTDTPVTARETVTADLRDAINANHRIGYRRALRDLAEFFPARSAASRALRHAVQHEHTAPAWARPARLASPAVFELAGIDVYSSICDMCDERTHWHQFTGPAGGEFATCHQCGHQTGLI